MEKKRRFGIEKKLFLCLVLGVIFPLLLLGFLSYYESQSVLQEEINISSRQLTEQKMKYLEVIMGEVDNLIANITRIEDVRTLLEDSEETISDYDRLATQARIGYILSGYTNLKGLVSIDIFSSSGQHFYVGDTLNIADINEAEKDRINNALEATDDSIIWMGIEDNVNVNSEYKRTIVAASPIRMNDMDSLSSKNMGFIIVNYNVDVFYDLFEEDNTDTDYMIIDRENRIVYHPDKSKIGTVVDTKFLDELTERKGTIETEYEKQQVSVSYEKLEDSSWIILATTPISTISDKVHNIMKNTLLILTFCIFLTLLFAIIVSKKFVLPIRDITHHFKEINENRFDFSTRVKVVSTDEIGELCSWFNVFTSVYEEKEKAKRELITAKEAAEAANIAKGQFLANMSHEIRTPINGIMGFLELLSISNPTPTQQEYIREGKSASQVLLYLINDILDFSKIEAGKLTMENIGFNLRVVVEDSVRLLAPKAHEKNIVIYSRINHNVPQEILGDPSRFKQIIINLLSNAVKFTAEGEVCVLVECVEVVDHIAHLQVIVKDTGIGISSENINKLFKSFNQADASTTRKYGGTGLGLVISKELTKLMNGDIRVESIPNRGSTFIIDVRLQVVKEAENRDIHKEEFKDVNIFIVDENESIRKSIKYSLENYGGNIYEASDVGGAVSCIVAFGNAAARENIVITDNRVSNMSGLEIISVLKNLPQGNKLRFIVMTLATEQIGENREHVCYVNKPIKKDELIKTIEDIIDHQVVEVTNEISLQDEAKRKSDVSNSRILVVEDNEMNQRILINIFNVNGMTCDIAHNGREAYLAVRKKDYDIVFMDCQMPIMDGFESTMQIRKDEGNQRHTTIIAMTANAMEGDREKCIQAGMDEYISKPINFKYMFQLIDKYTIHREKMKHYDLIEENIDRFMESSGLDRDIAYETLEGFVQYLPKIMESIKTSIEDERFEDTRRLVHQLKGSSGNLRITSIYEGAIELEVAAKIEDKSRCIKLYMKMHELIH